MNVIPRSIQLTAGRTARKYIRRKKRKGAFREGRYHATAVESGKHLIRCLAYIDLNRVGAEIVRHPDPEDKRCEWLDARRLRF